MKNNAASTKNLVLMGFLTALVIVFSITPIGSIPIGTSGLVVTLNVIPVAIAAVALGPVGGAIVGALFGLMSFLQCFGIGIPSGMGAVLVGINPFLAFIQRFVPRLLDGLLLGFIFKGTKKLANVNIAGCVTGFCAAFLNTLFFMTALILLFGNTDYVKELIDGRNVFVFVVAFVGLNAVLEMIASTIITGAVCAALHKAGMIEK